MKECSLELPPPGKPDLRAVHWAYKTIFDAAAKKQLPRMEAMMQVGWYGKGSVSIR